MKILHINRNYLTSALHQVMMRHLDEKGVDSTVFAPSQVGETPVIVPDENVIVSKCFNAFDRFVFDIKQAKIIASAEKKCNIADYDMIHAYTLFTDGNAAMRLSDKYGIPFAVAVRSTDVNDFFAKLPYLRARGIKIMPKASAICFLSKSYKSEVFDKYVPEALKEELYKKSYIIPNGIDDFWLENIFREQNVTRIKRVESRAFKLIYAGRINKNKNIHTVIEAMNELNSKGYKLSLTVVGKSEDDGELEKIKKSQNVTYIPAKPKEELIKLYRDSDIFVMPSFNETFGLVYAEAISQGVPVVYTKGQGFDGQFADGEVGQSVDPYSVKSVSDAIEKIAEDYACITDGLAEKAKKFSWGRIASEYDKLYKSIKSDSDGAL